MARFSSLNSLESLVEMTEGGTLSGAAFSGSSFKLLSSFYFFFVASCSFATALVNALTDFIKDAI
jgi:hypothetical protein